MTEIESFSVIPFSACPSQNLKGLITSPGQLIKTDLKLILQHPFTEQMSFALKTPKPVSVLDVANGSNKYRGKNRLG